jgi:hypothetical protein
MSFNKLKEARCEIYVGQWLPERAVGEAFDDGIAGDLTHDPSVALDAGARTALTVQALKLGASPRSIWRAIQTSSAMRGFELF